MDEEFIGITGGTCVTFCRTKVEICFTLSISLNCLETSYFYTNQQWINQNQIKTTE